MARNSRAHEGDWEAAKVKYPSTTELDTDGWLAFFNARPDVAWSMIGDIAKAVKAKEARESGGSVGEGAGRRSP